MCRQLGIVNFEPLRPYFLDLHAASQGYLPTLPGLAPLEAAFESSWSADDPTKAPTSPALVLLPPHGFDLSTTSARSAPHLMTTWFTGLKAAKSQGRLCRDEGGLKGLGISSGSVG